MLAVLTSMITAVGTAGCIPFLWAAYLNVVLFVLLRPLYYSAMSYVHYISYIALLADATLEITLPKSSGSPLLEECKFHLSCKPGHGRSCRGKLLFYAST